MTLADPPLGGTFCVASMWSTRPWTGSLTLIRKHRRAPKPREKKDPLGDFEMFFFSSEDFRVVLNQEGNVSTGGKPKTKKPHTPPQKKKASKNGGVTCFLHNLPAEPSEWHNLWAGSTRKPWRLHHSSAPRAWLLIRWSGDRGWAMGPVAGRWKWRKLEADPPLMCKASTLLG